MYHVIETEVSTDGIELDVVVRVFGFDAKGVESAECLAQLVVNDAGILAITLGMQVGNISHFVGVNANLKREQRRYSNVYVMWNVSSELTFRQSTPYEKALAKPLRHSNG